MTTVSEDQEAVVAPQEALPASPTTPTSPIKKEEKKKTKKDKGGVNKFAGQGVSFRGKLIGICDVPEARGDIMCQQSMQKLKEGVKQMGAHKQKIVINVSLVGLQIVDVNSMVPCHRHPVHRISFISRDVTDQRAFGYIFGDADGSHKFFAIKTEKAAEQLVLTLRDLFQCVFEMKKQEMEDAKLKQQQQSTEDATYDVPSSNAPVATETGEDGEALYAVPSNNTPVETNSGGIGNLLDLQSELNTIQQGIQQMDAFGDSFFTSQATAPASDPWGTTAQSPTTADNDPFVVKIQTQRQYEFEATFLHGDNQSAPANQPAAVPATHQMSPPINSGQLSFNASSQPAFNAFNSPQAVPPNQPAFNAFNSPQAAPPSQPAFNAFNTPQATPASQPAMNAGPTMVPFHQDPFFNRPTPTAAPDDKYSVFNSVQPAAPPVASPPVDLFATMPATNVLQPVQLQKDSEQQAQPKSNDFFGDLCDIGSNRPAKSDPFAKRDPFAEARASSAPKKSLNEMKNANGAVGPNATVATPESDPFSLPPTIPTHQPSIASNPNPFSSAAPANNSAPDPFAHFAGQSAAAGPPANDPFASFLAPQSTGSDELFNLPQPSGPPPPVPANNQLDMFNTAPAMPPRPSPGQGLLQGPPTAKPRQASGEAPLPRPRTSVRQNGAAPTGDPFGVFEAPAQSSSNPFGVAQTEVNTA